MPPHQRRWYEEILGVWLEVLLDGSQKTISVGIEIEDATPGLAHTRAQIEVFAV